jgi:hypothetical protein
MERESFEKEEIADLLNADFVSIKGTLKISSADSSKSIVRNVQISTRYT